MTETNAAYKRQTHERIQRVFIPSLSLNSNALRSWEFLHGLPLFKDHKPLPSGSVGPLSQGIERASTSILL